MRCASSWRRGRACSRQASQRRAPGLSPNELKAAARIAVGLKSNCAATRSSVPFKLAARSPIASAQSLPLLGARRLAHGNRHHRSFAFASRLPRRNEERGAGKLEPAIDRELTGRLRIFHPVALEQERGILQDRFALPEAVNALEFRQIRRQRATPGGGKD